MKLPLMKLPQMPRMHGWIALSIGLLALVYVTAPQQLTVVLYKSALLAIAAVATYWVDRSLFARLSDRLIKGMRRDAVSAARVVARGMIFLGCAIGITLGI
jgi:hypothetical protein